MSCDMDLSSMLLGDSELFPDCVLPSTGKDEVGDIFSDQPRGSLAGFVPSEHDDPLPDWLDLKMDLSFLEGLETTNNVLDDLLHGETNVGQTLDALPAFQMEETSVPSLDLKHVPFEQVPGKTHSPGDDPLHWEEGCPTRASSSPECLVPEMVSPDSPVYFVSSPDCTLSSRTTSPALTDTTVITFVAPLVQSVFAFRSALGVPCLSVALGDPNRNAPFEIQTDLTLPSIPLPSSASNTRKPKKRAPNLKKLKYNDDSKPSLIVPKSKKDRKRQQNKDAATRYRLKKRMEIDTVAMEGSQLLEQNKKLREKAQELARELSYLKKLMREMFKAKGLLN